ncbi:MAG: terminase small subunit [Lachnospiraceae bacterium]
MAANKNPLSEKAYEMYQQGMKLIDIAAKLNVPPGTVRRWKSTQKWNSERSESKSERSDKGRAVKKTVIDDGTRETLQNDELTPEQQMFCIYYSRTFNATQSYLKAYGCSYDVANAEGYKLLVKPCIRNEIERLKDIKRQQIVAGSEDIVEIQMRIAFADIGNYVTFGQKSVPVMAMYGPVQVENKETGKKEPLMKDVNVVCLNESDHVDTQIIQEVKEGRNGVSVKLADRQKAIDWLTKYFLIHPESKYRAEYERKKAEKEGGENKEYESDGFIEALKSDVAATFEGDDTVET